MSELDRVVLRAAVLKILSDRVNKAFRDAKEEAASWLGREGRKNAEYDGGKIASVSVTKGGRVTIDEAALTRWVEINYPTEVESVVKIRPAFLEAIKKATEAAGEPCSPLGDLDLPGVSVGDPYPLVRKADGADELVEKLWQSGRLSLDGEVKELEQ